MVRTSDISNRVQCWAPMLLPPIFVNSGNIVAVAFLLILLIQSNFGCNVCASAVSEQGRVLRWCCGPHVVDGIHSFELHTHTREDGINTIAFRRTLISCDAGDKEFKLDSLIYAGWAIVRMDSNNEPDFHEIHLKQDVKVHFNTSEPIYCFSFTRSEAKLEEIWERSHIFDKCCTNSNSTQKQTFYFMTHVLISRKKWTQWANQRRFHTMHLFNYLVFKKYYILKCSESTAIWKLFSNLSKIQ